MKLSFAHRVASLARKVVGRSADSVDLKMQSLSGATLPSVAVENLRAISARSTVKPRSVKVQNPEYSALRQDFAYHGICHAAIRRHPGVDLINLNDDMVAYCYFYFGPNAYEALSVFLYSEVAKRSHRVLDVGSFTGLFGVVAAKANHKADVVAFEPLPHIAERARQNAALNRLSNMTVETCALLAAVGRAQLTIFGGDLATTGASLAAKPIGDVGAIDVAVSTIDAYSRQRWGNTNVDLIKLDTEGDELSALAGAAETLAHGRPLVLSEVLNDAAVSAQCDYMAQYGYHASFVNEAAWRLVPVRNSKATAEPFKLKAFGYGNMLFHHPEKHSELIAETLAFVSPAKAAG